MRDNMNYESKEDRNYKKVHALYSKGYGIDEICSYMKSLPRWKTIDIIQKIEGKERAYKERRNGGY